MDYEVVRRIVTEEVLKHLGSVKSTVRVRRAVVTETMIVAARRRGSTSIEVAPGAMITPAAADRSKSLGIAITEGNLPARTSPEAQAVVEAVLASVIAAIEKRPRATARPAGGSRAVVTASDVELAHERHEKELPLDARARLTPLADDLARKYGIKISRRHA